MRIAYISSVGAGALSPATAMQRSQWESPVPWLFGGIAAMLGLIAFALLILACSYWKLSGEDVDGGHADDSKKAVAAPLEEKFAVIMAGEEKPTFLATRRPASFGEGTVSFREGNISKGTENPTLDLNQTPGN